MDLAGKRVMVIGLGVSGLAAARLLAARGARLVMTDLRADFVADSHAEAGARRRLDAAGRDPSRLRRPGLA